jgi:hypothetical protein
MVLLCVFISFRKRFLITYKIIYACIVSLSCSVFGIILFESLDQKIQICFFIIHLVYTAFLATLGIISAKKMDQKQIFLLKNLNNNVCMLVY